MPVVRFTQNIQRHVSCPVLEVPGSSIRDALEAYFSSCAQVRGYVLDDQGRLRQHMAVFVDGRQIADRETLSDPVDPTSVVDIIQALSGG